MFVNPTSVGISQRVVATLVACAVVLASIGYYTTAQAASLVNVKDTLSDSAPGVASNHTIAFSIPAGSAGVTDGQTITVLFPAGFSLTGVVFSDVDLRVAGVDQTLAAAAAGATWGASVSGQTLTITSGTGDITAGQAVEIEIGTNATFAGGTGANQIDNPAVGSYELRVTAGTVDSGRTRVAIVNTVLVSASVATTFTFTISGVATSTVINGETTTGSTSPTVINFGQLTAGPGNAEVLGQRLNVATNANTGFVVTVESDGDLESSNGAIIDVFDDGVDQPNPATTWNSPGNNIAQQNTWGHWGVTTRDSNLNSLGGFYTSEFAANEFISATTTPRAVFHHNGPSDLTINDVGSSTVAYKVEITALQEAADDYNTTLTYIATPTF